MVDNFSVCVCFQVGSRLAVWCEVDGWMHVAVDGVDQGPMLPITAKVYR